ncbi:MAG: single-stranded-DNA-specific exonuclease RecJ [Spirochaetales bacterium]|nr:single-stranded-DNA-specific exonuclease RecJ [Spirochaetales bacterium]
MDFILNRVQSEDVMRLMERYHLPSTWATVLARRGITSRQDVRFFLENGLGYLHSPFLFEDMEGAVERVLSAIEDKEKVCVFGDRDADGITSTALLVRELRNQGVETDYLLPEGDDPYGLTLMAVDRIRELGSTLVITVDCGISCNEAIDELNRHQIDTIVLDHHIAGETLPDAVAIIDPKAPSSGYPFEHLAGCGVTAKFIWALRFAQTDLWKSSVILLHAEPGPGDNTTTIIQAVQLENLVEVDRIVDEVPNGAVDLYSSRIVNFLARNLPVLVLDSATELKALRNAFGKGVDISLVDIRRELEAVIPRTRGKSLFELSKESRAVMYADGHEELETLISLFTSCCIYKYPSLSGKWISLLDLVAIGTIADLMPLKDENRILVRLGLDRLSKNPCQQLSLLLSRQNLIARPLSAQDIGWYVSPVINASGRLGKPSVAVELLLSDSLDEIEKRTGELFELNRERQKRGEDAWEKVKPKARKSLESFGSKFVMVEDQNIERGLTGALSSRILKECSAAPAVMVLADAKDGRISASIRSKNGFDSRAFLAKFSDLLDDFGGHRYAGGFSMKVENLPAFRKAVEEEVLSMDIVETDDAISVDLLLNKDTLNEKLISLVESFEPYGEQNPALVFMAEGPEIRSVTELGSDRDKGHLRLVLAYGKYQWNCVYWGAKGRYPRDFTVGDRVRVIFRLGRNYWKGASSLQLTLMAMEKLD